MNIKYIISIVIIAIIAVGGWKLANLPETPESQEQKMGKEETMEDKTTETKKPNKAMVDVEKIIAKGEYADYSKEAVESAQTAGKKVVLFFHANWCPDCKAADTSFRTTGEKIPAGVIIFKTNYDSEKDLKTKYGVTYQHTFVQIDNGGNQVTKWISGDTDLLNKNLK